MTPSHCHCYIVTYRALSTTPLALKPYAGSAPSMLAIPSQNSLPQAASASAGDTCVSFSRALGKQPTVYVTGVKDIFFFLVAVFAPISSLGRTEDVIPMLSADQVQEQGKCRWKLLLQHSQGLFLCHSVKSLTYPTETQSFTCFRHTSLWY